VAFYASDGAVHVRRASSARRKCPKSHTANASPGVSRWSELSRSSAATFRSYKISRCIANARHRIRRLNWIYIKPNQINANHLDFSILLGRVGTIYHQICHNVDNDPGGCRSIYKSLSSTRATLRLFVSFFIPSCGWNLSRNFFSEAGVRLAACVANTWLPIFVLSWEIKFTLRNYCCKWGGRERERERERREKKRRRQMRDAEIGLVYLRHERGAYGHSCVFENTKRHFTNYYELFYL